MTTNLDRTNPVRGIIQTVVIFLIIAALLSIMYAAAGVAPFTTHAAADAPPAIPEHPAPDTPFPEGKSVIPLANGNSVILERDGDDCRWELRQRLTLWYSGLTGCTTGELRETLEGHRDNDPTFGKTAFLMDLLKAAIAYLSP